MDRSTWLSLIAILILYAIASEMSYQDEVLEKAPQHQQQENGGKGYG